MEQNKKIYIVLTHTGTFLSKIIKNYTKDEFSHVSIALDKELNKMYSFGRLNPYNPFVGGFIHEYIDKGTFKRFFNTKAQIYSLEVTEEQYEKINNTINQIEQNKNEYKFNVLGLFAVGFNVKIRGRKSFYCAEFVKYLLEEAKLECELPELIRPDCFKDIKKMQVIYNGFLRNYRLTNQTRHRKYIFKSYYDSTLASKYK